MTRTHVQVVVLQAALVTLLWFLGRIFS